MQRPVYITGVGAFLPGEPVVNDDLEDRLGAPWASGRLKSRIVEASGIVTRHYALDRTAKPPC